MRFYLAKMVIVILDEIGLERNWIFAFSTLTFKRGQNNITDHIIHSQCFLYTFTITLNPTLYIQCILVMVYTHIDAKNVFLLTIFLFGRSLLATNLTYNLFDIFRTLSDTQTPFRFCVAISCELERFMMVARKYAWMIQWCRKSLA